MSIAVVLGIISLYSYIISLLRLVFGLFCVKHNFHIFIYIYIYIYIYFLFYKKKNINAGMRKETKLLLLLLINFLKCLFEM